MKSKAKRPRPIKKKSSGRSFRYVFYALTVITLIVGGWFWSSGLSTDPSLFYSVLSQATLTDPSNVVYHARNEALFGDTDPFDYGRWTVFEYSLTSLAARLWFAVAGVSYAQSNAVGLILNLLALLLFLAALSRHHNAWVLWIVATVWLINNTLIIYGRLPFLENGLILLAASAYLAYSWWGKRLWGVVLTAALIAAATVMGKLFGALLAPALVLAIWFSDRPRHGRDAVVGAAAYVVSMVLLMVLLYAGRLDAVFAYTGEQAYGLRGFPVGLTSPLAFFEHLMSYGSGNRLIFMSPDIFVFLLLAFAGLILCTPIKDTPIPRTLTFAAAWIVCVVLGLSPHEYSPLRYATFLIPAVIVCCFGVLDYVTRQRETAIIAPGPARTIALGLLLWYGLTNGLGQALASLGPSSELMVWTTLLPAAALAYGIRRYAHRRPIIIRRRYFVGAIVALIILSVGVQAHRIRQGQFTGRTANLVHNSEDLTNIVGQDAVIAGSYGPALTMDTNLKTFIHMFGVAQVDSTLFDRQPITHLAIDEPNYEEAVKGYPQLAGQQAIASYWISGWEIKLFKVNTLFDNPDANGYVASGYERAVALLWAGKVDASLTTLQEYLRSHRLTRSSGLLLTTLYVKQGRSGDAINTITTLAKQYSDDFFVQMQCGRFYYHSGLVTKDRGLLARAEQYFQRGIQMNRFQADYVEQIKQQVRKTIAGQL